MTREEAIQATHACVVEAEKKLGRPLTRAELKDAAAALAEVRQEVLRMTKGRRDTTVMSPELVKMVCDSIREVQQ